MSKKMGRRAFVKGATSAVLGLATAPLVSAGKSFAQTDKGKAVEYRTLGKTGLKVTAVSMGVMNCSDPAVILRAYDLGVNFFDTARRYMGGRNEEIVGKALMGKRNKVLIQTKVRMASSEKENRESVETSLKSLRTDYVDVLLAHSLKTQNEVCDAQIIEFLQAMKKEGKARFTGFSTHTDMAPLLRAAAKARCHEVALTSYNFTHSNDLKEAIALAAKAGIGVVAMKTQAGGYKAHNMRGLSPHQAALKYALMDRNVSTAVPGVKTIEEIEECVAVMGTTLSKDDSDTLDQYDSYLQGRICTMCGGCEGECPHGVNHTDLLRVVMYHDGYNSDKLVDEMRRESGLLAKCKQCSECSSCSITCRRGLDIRAQIDRVMHILA
jgi:aryl-alcohol dehydrogenase-like predicted oxidoreductase